MSGNNIRGHDQDKSFRDYISGLSERLQETQDLLRETWKAAQAAGNSSEKRTQGTGIGWVDKEKKPGEAREQYEIRKRQLLTAANELADAAEIQRKLIQPMEREYGIGEGVATDGDKGTTGIRCTDESQVPSIVMTASRGVQLGARRGRAGDTVTGAR